VGSLCRARPRPRSRPLSTHLHSAVRRPWPIVERRALPATLHGELPETHGQRLACICAPLKSAVVIGSAQAADDFDAGRLKTAGVDLVRRRSGGGAVLVSPGAQVWIDVFVPSGDELADKDVGNSFYWLGELFAAALKSVLGLPQGVLDVHRGAPLSTPWSKVLCFAGLGAGEVSVSGRKVVGMSQRRQRSGSWIHSMAILEANDLAELISGPPRRRAEARSVLEASGLRGCGELAGPLAEELLSLLP